MRVAILAVLVACGSSEEPAECIHQTGSIVKYTAGLVASGVEVAGVSWREQHNDDEPINHAALVFPDGTMSPDIRVANRHLGGVGGTTSVLWQGSRATSGEPQFECNRSEIFDVVLQRADGVTITIDIVPGITRSRAVAFDGTRYQVFWFQGDAVQHRSLDEDGTLGPIHTIATSPDDRTCVTAASDRAGRTFLGFNQYASIVDTTTGIEEALWSGATFTLPTRSFYFTGKFYLPRSPAVVVDIATRNVTVIEEPAGGHYYPTRTRLYTSVGDNVIEVDANLRQLDAYPNARATGTIENDRLFLNDELPPGQRAYVGVTRDGEVAWKQALAVNSEIVELGCVPE